MLILKLHGKNCSFFVPAIPVAARWPRALPACLKADGFEAHSPEVESLGPIPHAVSVIAEAGVDISGQQSTRLDKLSHICFDWVVTVCAHAAEQCPEFPGMAQVEHRAFDDPPKLARCDEIRAYVETL